MSYWLLKSEPESYSWDDLCAERRTVWDGVRNAEARKNLARMRAGDRAFFYHSGGPREIVGIVKIARAAFPDPTDPRWLAVDVTPAKSLPRAVRLGELRGRKSFESLALVARARLSVQPVSDAHWHAILRLSESEPAAPSEGRGKARSGRGAKGGAA